MVLGRSATAAVIVGLAVYCWSACPVQTVSLPVYTEAARRMWQGDPGLSEDSRSWVPDRSLHLPAAVHAAFPSLIVLPPVAWSVLWFLVDGRGAGGNRGLVRNACAVVMPQRAGPRVVAFWSLFALLVARHVLSGLEQQARPTDSDRPSFGIDGICRLP